MMEMNVTEHRRHAIQALRTTAKPADMRTVESYILRLEREILTLKGRR
jgi:hypothetical protein